MRILLLCCLLLVALPVGAKEIEGVNVADTLQNDDGTVLYLNGAGVRTKFFFDIYIAGLYMENPANKAEEVVAATGRKRVVMHFLYSEVSKEKLTDAWNEGFEDNSSAAELKTLQERIDKFNSLFVTVKENDVIVLDYSQQAGTVVTIRGEERGRIEGKDFNDALLKIWIGDEPVTSSLKKDLLAYKK